MTRAYDKMMRAMYREEDKVKAYLALQYAVDKLDTGLSRKHEDTIRSTKNELFDELSKDVQLAIQAAYLVNEFADMVEEEMKDP